VNCPNYELEWLKSQICTLYNNNNVVITLKCHLFWRWIVLLLSVKVSLGNIVAIVTYKFDSFNVVWMMPLGFLHWLLSSVWHLQKIQQASFWSLQGHVRVAHFMQLHFVVMASGRERWHLEGTMLPFSISNWYSKGLSETLSKQLICIWVAKNALWICPLVA
jgi:hypothetical protein